MLCPTINRKSKPINIDLSIVKKRLQKTQAGYVENAFVQQQLAQQLLSRLQYIKFQPQCLLDASLHVQDLQSGLAQQFPAAQITSVPMIDLASNAFADQQFDGCIANLGLCWVNDITAVLQTIQRIVKPGGLILLTSLGPDTLRELRDSFVGIDQAAHCHSFIDMHHVGDAMLAAGFHDPVVDAQMITLRYNTIDRLMKDLRLTGANSASHDRLKSLMTPRRWQQFIKQYETCKVDHKFPVTLEVVTAHAWVSQPRRSDEVTISIDQIGGYHGKE